MPLAILAGSPPAAPALASDRQSRPRSHGEYCHAAFDRGVYSCMHRRPLAKSYRLELCAPISSSLTPRPNPHSVRCTAAAHLPRFRALALLGRRPPQRVDGLIMPASEKPAQQQTHAPRQVAPYRSACRCGRARLIRAIPLSENPQSSASQFLIAGSERSTPIL